MSLSVGTRLGPYEVVAPLGAGGMGEVYRARDARLGRDVAIKILPDVVAADPERKARFEREARMLASLNHPNVAGIHGVEDSQGIPALVLELVEGPTPDGEQERSSVWQEVRLVMHLVLGRLRTIVRVDRDGKEEALPGIAPGNFGTIRMSPDGTRFAYDVGRPSDVWVYEFARGTTTRITTTDSVDGSALWTVDGSRLVYSSTRDGRAELYVKNADGSGAPERVLSGNSPAPRLDPDAWSPGGELLLVTAGRGTNADILAVRFNADRQTHDVLASSSTEAGPAISPDGRWVAYHSNVSGTVDVYVERFPGLGERQRISTSGGSGSRWSPNSRELFFQSADGRRIFAVPVTLGAKFGVGNAKMLFEGPYVRSGPGVRGFEVMPDGRFLMIKAASVSQQNSVATVTVVQNWTEELKRLVPVPGRAQ